MHILFHPKAKFNVEDSNHDRNRIFFFFKKKAARELKRKLKLSLKVQNQCEDTS